MSINYLDKELKGEKFQAEEHTACAEKLWAGRNPVCCRNYEASPWLLGGEMARGAQAETGRQEGARLVSLLTGIQALPQEQWYAFKVFESGEWHGQICVF